ncbi:four helix bundle protein [Myroides odoratimimus]|uniref:four helix bundle protein n=1 Tax=Myroides odoratimimus TaxID=76832 RepID=UPI003101981D
MEYLLINHLLNTKKTFMFIYYFERLEVWKNARSLSKDIHILTNRFPKEELFGLVSQLRRATYSIPANITEGMSRNSSKEKLRFLNIAYSSAMEVINFLILSLDLEFLTIEEYNYTREKIGLITNQIYALSKKIGKS